MLYPQTTQFQPPSPKFLWNFWQIKLFLAPFSSENCDFLINQQSQEKKRKKFPTNSTANKQFLTMASPGERGLEEFGETYGIGLETVRGLMWPWPCDPLAPCPDDVLPPLKSCCFVISLKCLKNKQWQCNILKAVHMITIFILINTPLYNKHPLPHFIGKRWPNATKNGFRTLKFCIHVFAHICLKNVIFRTHELQRRREFIRINMVIWYFSQISAPNLMCKYPQKVS